MTMHEINGTHTWMVTGAAGFIGGNIAEYLLKQNQRVIGLDNLSSGGMERINAVENALSPEARGRFCFIKGDIRDAGLLDRSFSGVDYVLHEAALVSVPESLKEPSACNEINVTGFLNVLDAARKNNVKRMVYASSFAVYDNAAAPPLSESAPVRPISPYGASKRINEIYADLYLSAYGFCAVGLRYANIYGPGQNPNGEYAAVIAKWISAALKGDAVYIFGDGENTRDFCYVEDVVKASVSAALSEKAGSGGVFNIGCGKKATLNETCRRIYEIVESQRPGIKIPAPVYKDFRDGDIRHSYADIGRARETLGFSPSCGFEKGLEKTVAWFKKRLGEGAA